MKRMHMIALLLAALTSAVTVSARAGAGGVSYPSGKDTVSAYLAVPDGTGPFPAIVVVHEWWGLNEWVRANARDLAKKGYIALAVDLYRGKSTDSAETAHELYRGLPEDRAARDLSAAVTYLRTRSDVDKKHVGSLGWCMGGGFSLVTALHTPDLAACVICYGRLVTDSSAIASIPCPILGIFGEDDKGITPADVHAFAGAAKEQGKSVEVQIYKGAGHAFMNSNNKDGYRAESTKDAWTRIDAFLAGHLKK